MKLDSWSNNPVRRLKDKSDVIEARVDEALLNANRTLFKDDELVIVMGKLQPDRFSGGMQLTVNQVWSLDQARCRFGKFLKVTLNGRMPDVARLLKEFPPQRQMTEQGELVRGLGLRLALRCAGPDGAATAQLQLADEVRFFPSDAALSSWRALADEGQAAIIYD